MKHSESIEKISLALLAAQRKIGAAKKGATNPFFKSTYADLGSVMEACKDALNENGVTVLQPVTTNKYGVCVETVLLHLSGQWLSASMKISPKSDMDPQAQGSAISYARRYSLQAMVFIPAEDDDAEKAKKSISYPTARPEVSNTKLGRVSGRCPECHSMSGHSPKCSIGRAFKMEKSDEQELAEEVFDIPDPDVTETQIEK